MRNGWVWAGATLALLGLASVGIGGGGNVPAPRLSSSEMSPNVVYTALAPAFSGCSTSALCPGMVQSAYNLSSVIGNRSTDGKGQTIVIVDACGDSSIQKDLKGFDAAFGLPNATLNVTHLGPHKCYKANWSIETALDVEWAHTMAPAARIHLVVTSSGTNSVMFSAWNYSLVNHLGNQISDSWGGPGGCNSTVRGYIATAASQNVTILAASGDYGAWGAGQAQTAFMPADCPGILSVGGTTLKVSSAGRYSSESGWSGSGGGFSGRYAEPAYQTLANITDKYGDLGCPDVSADADPSTGVWVYDSSLGGWGVVGGTSLATPLWAGFLADVNDQRAVHHYAPLGDFHAYLYGHVYGVNGKSANFTTEMHDVTKGNNGWAAAVGWDPVTGLGSMNGAPLLRQLGNDPTA